MRRQRRGWTAIAIALAVLVGVLIGVLGPAVAMALPIPSITGMRTMPDNSADNHTVPVVYWMSGGSWTPTTTASVLVNTNGTYSVSGLVTGSYRVGEPALFLGATVCSPVYNGGGQFLAAAPNVSVIAGSTTANVDLHRAASDTVTTDTAEPDNTPKQAQTIVPGASWAERTLFGKPDSDWIKFNAVQGHWYTVETSGTVAHPVWGSVTLELTDTYVHLFASDGKTVLACNDDDLHNGVYSAVQWRAVTTGTLYARVTSYAQARSGSPVYGAYAVHVVDGGADDNPTTLQVSVVDSSTGVGIPGALVQISNTDVDMTRPTDAHGSASFAGVPARGYSVAVSAVSYASTGTWSVAAAGTTTHANVYMQPPRPLMLGVLGGSVQFAEGGPATLATVTIVGPSGPQTQLVDGSGYFYFGNLPLGLYSVTISDPGYRGVVHGDLLVGSVNSSVWQTTTLDVLAPVGNVSGRVTCGGAGVGGATVSAGEVLTITAADGSYMLAGVDAGSAHATFSKAGFVSQELPVFVTQGATNLLNASLNYEQTGCTIARSPDKSSLSYKRRKGSVKFTLQATLSGPYWKFVAAPAYLQTSSNGKSRWKTAYQLKTNAAGVATKAFTARSKSTKYYRWYAPSTAMHAATYSGKQKVVVK